MESALAHLAVITILTVAACAAVLGGLACTSVHRTHALKEAGIATAAILAWVSFWYWISWPYSVGAGLWGLAAAAFIGENRTANPGPTKQQRTKVEEVMPPRVGTDMPLSVKAGWDGKIRAKYNTTGIATELSITLPLTLSNKKLANLFAAVCSDVMDGHWTAEPGPGNSIVATLDDVESPLLVPYLEVLRHPKMLGEDATMTLDDAPEDNVVQMTAYYSAARAAEIAHGEQRAIIERKFNELCPAGEDQRWLFEFAIDKGRTTIKRSTFARVIPHTLINQPVLKTVADAIAYYPELILPCGMDDRSNLVSWRIGEQGQVDALICGAQGSGKSASVATRLTEAIAGGCAVVLADFKYSDSFDRFADLPNMHLYTREYNENLRAIAYVEHVMRCRNNGTKPPAGAPPKGVPIVLFVDEAPTFFRDAPEEYARMALSIQEKGRSERIHLVLAAQNITARTIPTDNLRLCSYREQWGFKDISESLLLWGNANVDIGSKVPVGVPGRGVVTSPDGKPVFIQGFYTPGTETNRPLSANEQKILDALRAAILETVTPLYAVMEVLPGAVRPGDNDIWTSVRPVAAAGSFADAPLPDDYTGCNTGCNTDTDTAPIGGDGRGVLAGVTSGETVTSPQVAPAAGVITFQPDSRLPQIAETLIDTGVTNQPPRVVVAVLQSHLDGKLVNGAAKAAGVHHQTAKRIIDAYEERIWQ